MRADLYADLEGARPAPKAGDLSPSPASGQHDQYKNSSLGMGGAGRGGAEMDAGEGVEG